MSTTTWQIDPAHTSVNFAVKHMMVARVHGRFNKINGELFLDDRNPANSKLEATIDAESIDTQEEKRDAHLKGADFFDIERFPKITFRSQEIQPESDGHLKVKGDLTLHGVTKPVVLDVDGPSHELKDPFGQIKIAAHGETKIKRKDFGLTWNAALETGGVLVGDDIKIELDVQFVKKNAS
jgi:polyisoprenoid-binding protein YceI